MQPLTRVDTAPLFPGLHALLIDLLRSLTDADWQRPTVAPAWRVRDIAGHLLDVHLRKLSFGRDRHRVAGGPVSSYGDIVTLINGLNAEGVSYSARLSPRVIIEIIDVAGRLVSEFVASCDPDEPATFSVLWAGEEQSKNWMDIGREYTEHWHHQMQIRDAVGASPVLLAPEWFNPLLDLSVRAFRRSFKDLDAPDGTAIAFEVETQGLHSWTIARAGGVWDVFGGLATRVDASVRMDGDTAWRLLYNALPRQTVRSRITVSGNERLAAPLLTTRSVMV